MLDKIGTTVSHPLRCRSICGIMATMAPKKRIPARERAHALRDTEIQAAQAALDAAMSLSADAALPHLRTAAEHVSAAINEALAQAVVDEGATLRAAATRAGLSENAVGPRLASSALLGAYSVDGRVTAAGVERARYDREEGRHRSPDRSATTAARGATPLRFRARRPN